MANQATLQFLTESLPSFTVGKKSSFKLQATGGTKPYAFKIESGALPTKLALNANGTISGVVLKAADDSTVFITVRDSKGAKATQAFDVEVGTPA
jgi:hypothetical protein